MLFEQGLPGEVTQTVSEEYHDHRNTTTKYWEFTCILDFAKVWGLKHMLEGKNLKFNFFKFEYNAQNFSQQSFVDDSV